jgi:addiction module HigA family antidote
MTKQNEYCPQLVPHPGVDLTEKLEELGFDTKEFATRTGISERTISDILKGNISISAEIAEQFEKILHIPTHYWLNRQRSYDEYKI